MHSHSPWFGYNMFVQKLDSALKASKLHHGVWNLSHPQGRKAFVEPDNEQMQNLTQEFKYMTVHYEVKNIEQLSNLGIMDVICLMKLKQFSEEHITTCICTYL